jgi:hypothetical protein
MKDLALIALGIAAGFVASALIANKQEQIRVEEQGNIPAFYWNDRVNPPHRGFELKVDMYWNETKDTIYMEYSSGPEGE